MAKHYNLARGRVGPSEASPPPRSRASYPGSKKARSESGKLPLSLCFEGWDSQDVDEKVMHEK